MNSLRYAFFLPLLWVSVHAQVTLPAVQGYSHTEAGVINYSDVAEHAQTNVVHFPGTYTSYVPQFTSNNYPNFVGTALSSIATSLAPLPTVSADSLASATGFTAYSTSELNLHYSFQIFGPNAFVPVQVDALGTIFGNYSGRGVVIAIASFQLSNGFNPNTNIYKESRIQSYVPQNTTADVINGHGGFQISSIYNLQTYTRYDVSLWAIAAVDTTNGSASASAFVDPSFQIALPGAQASQYSFQFSPGIGNTPASSVPDAGSSAALLAMAFAPLLVGLRVRRREFFNRDCSAS